jgi:hypothetical protein
MIMSDTVVNEDFCRINMPSQINDDPRGDRQSESMSTLSDEILRWHTFAIISRPDSRARNRCCLTARSKGEVKARSERRRVRSDWMAVERERGISVSSAVMSFEHEGLAFNLLDTPGHQDFSEDPFVSVERMNSHAVAIIAWYLHKCRWRQSCGRFALKGVGDT